MAKNLVIFNAESAYFFFNDPSFYSCVINFDCLACDSVSLSIVLRLIGVRHKRLHGPDIFSKYLQNNKDCRIAIIGGSPEAQATILAKYYLSDVLFWDKTVDLMDISEESKLICEFQPIALFVCLGLRRQEWFVSELLKSTDGLPFCHLIAGVGAAVDFEGETKKRAGRFMRAAGLEWLPRLIREPRMMPRIIRSIVGCFLIILNFRVFSRHANKFLLSLSEVGIYD